MSSRSLVTLTLLVLVILSAALLTLGGDRGTSRNRTLADLDTAAVDRIRVIRQDKPDLVFEKNGADWYLTEPVQVRASRSRIESVLALPGSPSHGRIDAGKAGLETLGLAPPAMRVMLGERGFDFGGTDPIDRYRYVRSGDAVHLIDDRLFPQLNQPPAFFADTRLLEDTTEILRITYPDHVILRRDVNWTRRPAPLAAGPQPSDIVEHWRRARARQTLPYGGGQAAGRVRIKTGTGKIEFDILAGEEGLLLARPGLGLQYRLTADTAAALGLADYLGK